MKPLSKILFPVVATVISLLLMPFATSAKEFTVVIDPGHGGKDYGAIGAITNEKTINLSVAKLFADKIRKSGRDVKVVLTRENDTFIPLNDRAQIANKAKGDLFISIHVNSVAKKNKNRANIQGAEIYTVGLHKTEENLAVAQRENAVITLEEDYTETYNGFDPNSVESYIAFELTQSSNLDHSIAFAAEAQNKLVFNAGRADRGVRQAGFWVLWATSMPSVLVELDFISNPKSEKFMASDNGREQLATALYDAFIHYHSLVTNSHPGATTYTPVEPAEDIETEVLDDLSTPVILTSADVEGGEGNMVPPVTPADSQTVARQEVQSQKDTVAPVEKLEFRIQILTSPRPLKKRDPMLKGETGAQNYVDGGLYKYTIGSYATEQDALRHLPAVRKKFRDAFVIKMINGKRIK